MPSFHALPGMRLLFACAALLLTGAAAHAQTPHDSTPSAPYAVWASVGLGPSSGGVAGIVRANMSLDRYLVTYRATEQGPFFGTGFAVSERALLVGARTPGKRIFGSAAIGYADAGSYHQSDGCAQCDRRHGSSLAYELGAHANALVPGLALTFAGAAGPSHTSWSAMTVSLELGWFGR